MGRKSKSKVKNITEACFMRDLIKYAMDIYGYTYKPTESTGQNTQSATNSKSFCKQTSSPFCIHIGEAVIALSYVNRLNFKLRFEENCDFIAKNTVNLNKFVTDFCKEIYVEGYFDQFFVVYGFVIDLLLYMAYKKQVYYYYHLVELFNVLFPAVLKDKFMQRGGWVELKRKARPWSHTYRHLSEDLAYSFDLRSPGLVLFNNNYTKELISMFKTAIKTYEEYEDRTYPDDSKEAYEGHFSELRKRMDELTPKQQACSINSCQLFCLTKVVSKKGTLLSSEVHRGKKLLRVDSTNATFTSASQDISANTQKKSRRRRKKSPTKLTLPASTSQTSSELQTALICDSETIAISLDVLGTTSTDTSRTISVSEGSTHTSETDTLQTFPGSVDIYQTALADLSHKCWASEDIPEIATTDISLEFSLPQSILQTETVDASQTLSSLLERSPAALADTSSTFIAYNILESTSADISQKDFAPEGIPQTSSAERLHTYLAFEGIPQTSLAGTSERFLVSEDSLETASDDTSRTFSLLKDIPQASSAATFQKFSPLAGIFQPEFFDTSSRCVVSKDILEVASTDIFPAFSVPKIILQTEFSGTPQTFAVSSELTQTALADSPQMFSAYNSSEIKPADTSLKSPTAESVSQTSFTDNSQKFAVSEDILKTESADNSQAISLPKDTLQTETAHDSQTFSFFAELPQTALTDNSKTFEVLENVFETTSNDISVPFSVPECIPQNSNSETPVVQVATETPQRNSVQLLKRVNLCEELLCSFLVDKAGPLSNTDQTPFALEVREKDESCDELKDTNSLDETVEFFRATMKEVKKELSKH